MVVLFIGWCLIFLAIDSSVVITQTGEVTGWLDKIYFVGYSFTTHGNGDLRPAIGIYQVMTPIIAASGFATLSLSVTYLISVISAAVNKMNVASKITSIGETVEGFVIMLWKVKHFQAIDLILNTISSELTMLHEQHKAYPALHYFHTSEYKKSVAYALAVLDDALNIIEFGLDEKEKPSPFIIYNCRQIIEDYLSTISSKKRSGKDVAPPAISIQKIKEAEMKTKDEKEFFRKVDAQKERRKMLFRMVRDDGWDWYSSLH
ncbi:MAG: two pore domain potassium channel family protein [Bacteroidetes bacterium]|nr:two pore domain potassium channel family protein [Bacteroidota bacterium]